MLDHQDHKLGSNVEVEKRRDQAKEFFEASFEAEELFEQVKESSTAKQRYIRSILEKRVSLPAS